MSTVNARSHAMYSTSPARVHEVLGRHILADGMKVVFDPDASHDAYMVDARDGTEYLDLFSFFASLPLGFGHPGLQDPAYLARLHQVAGIKPTNSDVYTQAMADFVDTFRRIVPPSFPHLFFVEGGALAVENALKAAFDWKVRKNIAAGRPETLGTQVLHFVGAFHGRSGYTLSLTNTFDPSKTKYFPKFPWPRVSRPAPQFPQTPESLAAIVEAERKSMEEVKEAIARHPHDIAAVIIETIQGEGGDVHFRPEFLVQLREICDAEEMILIFDEVQCGMGLTGKWWAFEHLGVTPDIFSFGKKSQVCGIASTDRVDEVDSVFKVPSRINSTWGGNLVDMVRCQRYIEIIESDGLLDNVRDVGAYARKSLSDLAANHPEMSNVRGRGLMCAFDLDSSQIRDKLRKKLMGEERVIILGCGDKSLRLRPVLDFTVDHVDETIRRIGHALGSLS